MKIYNNVFELIGNTPLMELKYFEKASGENAKIYAKLECFNPAGSAKDRIALKMLQDAEKCGVLKEGMTVIEPTSGNTGIGLASVCAAKGLKAIFTMPENMSEERIKLLKAYGAEVVLTPKEKGMSGAIEKAEELKNTLGGFIPGQFKNPSNPKAHYETTGPEIFDATDGNVDIFVAGIGTGGTLCGTGRYLKEKKPDIKIIGVEPFSSPLISSGMSGTHGIQGIGANFIPDNYDADIVDEIFTVSDENAYEYGRKIASKEGLLVGISSGAAVCAAEQIARRPETQGKTIVVLLPDTGERYLSTPMFSF